MAKEEKADVNIKSAYRLLYPMHTVLVSCIAKTGKPNIITLAWTMPTSLNPPLVAVSISPRRHSHALIKERQEFVINIPTMEILDETEFCGTVSGKSHNKFKETGLTRLRAKKVKAPLIKECLASLECKVHSQFPTGDHTIFVGEIVKAYVNRGVFTTTYNLKKANMIFHLGGNKFATLAPKVFKPKSLRA